MPPRSTFPFSQPLAGLQARGIKAVFAGEGQEARKEADQAAIVFGDGGGQIVIGDLARDATQRRERMNVTTDEGLEALAVSELQIRASGCAHRPGRRHRACAGRPA